ncbi:hypothetical protein NBRC110019_30460 [Neptunitalea chrysea]|uniref:Uncharacterized protein n=1 Tax=Neptunitalea chrysea TaxID=1647581 RepID=A0A9W6EUW6_9FLAO|nr:hypothetical protein NBRC110019_30460 [Neptunitalea chrysea]
MNLDPLAENYYRWTPYNYCTQDPVNMVDKGGMYVTLADNVATKKYIEMVLKSPELRKMYDILVNSDVHYHIVVADSFDKKEFGKEPNRELSIGGMTGFSKSKKEGYRINILVKNTDNEALNIAALADEINTATQFNQRLIGFVFNLAKKEGVSYEPREYDPIDEVNNKMASVSALKANGKTTNDMDSENKYQSTKVMKVMKNGITDYKELIDILYTTQYKYKFEANGVKDPYQDTKVSDDCGCGSPRYM